MLITAVSIVALTLAVALSFGWSAFLRFQRQTFERLHATETKLAALEAVQDGMAADWSRIYANTEKSWEKHVARITEDAALQLALKSSATNNRPKARR